MSITETTGTPAPIATDPKLSATPAEAPKAPEAKAEPKDEKFSSKFAALSRQEKKFREEQAKWKAEREAETKEWNPKLEAYKKHEELRSKAKGGDKAAAMQALSDLGLTYDEITQLVLNDNKPTPEMIARQAMERAEKIEREIAERENAQKENQSKAEKEAEAQAVATFKTEIANHIEANADTFALCQGHPDAVNLAYQVIEEHFKATKRVLTPEEALTHVENHIQAEIEEKVLKNKKVQRLLAERTAPQGHGGGEGTPKGAISQPTRTLSNSVATNAPTPTGTKPKSLEESKAEAAKLLKWT